MASYGLSVHRHLLPNNREAQALYCTAFEADGSALPKRLEIMWHRAQSSWLAAALGSVLGAQPEIEQTQDKSVDDQVSHGSSHRQEWVEHSYWLPAGDGTK